MIWLQFCSRVKADIRFHLNLILLTWIIFKDKLNNHLKMHERRGAEREYLCNICGEVFRNIFPLQAHQRNVHQVGAGKRKRTDTTTSRPKRARVSQGKLCQL